MLANLVNGLLGLAGFLTILGLVWGLGRGHKARRRVSIEAEARRLDWEPAPGRAEFVRRQIEQFPLGIPAKEVRLVNVIRVPNSELEIYMGDCQLVSLGAPGQPRRRGPFWQTVVWVRTPRMSYPSFALGGRNFHGLIGGSKFDQLASCWRREMLPGYSEVRFNSPQGFLKKFNLLTPNPAEVERFFTEKLLEELGELKPFQYEGGFFTDLVLGGSRARGRRFWPNGEGVRGDLLYYLAEVRIPPAQLSAFASNAVELVELFRRSTRLPNAPVHFENSRWITECPECRQKYDVSTVLGDSRYDFSPEPGQQMNCQGCGTLFSLSERFIRLACSNCGGPIECSETLVRGTISCDVCGQSNAVPRLAAPAQPRPRITAPGSSEHNGESGSASRRCTVEKPLDVRPIRNVGAWVIIGFATIWMSFVAYSTLSWARTVTKQGSTESWPSVPGQIINDKIERRERPSGKTGRTSVFYVPRLTYKYSVNGIGYIGTWLQYAGYSFPTESHTREFLERRNFVRGSSVPVYYDPARPSEAVLMKGADGRLNSFNAVVLATFGAVGAALLWSGIRGLRTSQRP